MLRSPRADAGESAFTNKVIRGSLRDGPLTGLLRPPEFAALKADIHQGMADVATGRRKEFNAGANIERGTKPFAGDLQALTHPAVQGLDGTRVTDPSSSRHRRFGIECDL